METLKKIWRSIGVLKYVIVIIIAAPVILFIGENSFLERYKHKQKIAELQEEIEKYDEMHKHDSLMVKRLERDPRYIEKIARERYFMKADNEDIFVLSDDLKK